MFEVKQACYGGTAALRIAASMVAAGEIKRALVISTDTARCVPHSYAEPAQGRAASRCWSAGAGAARARAGRVWRARLRSHGHLPAICRRRCRRHRLVAAVLSELLRERFLAYRQARDGADFVTLCLPGLPHAVRRHGQGRAPQHDAQAGQGRADGYRGRFPAPCDSRPRALPAGRQHHPARPFLALAGLLPRRFRVAAAGRGVLRTARVAARSSSAALATAGSSRAVQALGSTGAGGAARTRHGRVRCVLAHEREPLFGCATSRSTSRRSRRSTTATSREAGGWCWTPSPATSASIAGHEHDVRRRCG